MTNKEIQYMYRRGVLITTITAALLVVVSLIVSCGASNATLVRPVYDATRLACRTLQEQALSADDRDTVVQRVDEIRSRCDVAYAGIEAAGLLLEEVRDDE